MTRTRRKSPSPEPAAVPVVASVHSVAATADVFIEAAAIIRTVLAEIVPRFHATGERLPALLLQRPGQGTRPASVDAIVEAEARLEGLAREVEARAQELYGLRVAVAHPVDEHAAARPLVDDVVDAPPSPREKKAAGSPNSATEWPRS